MSETPKTVDALFNYRVTDQARFQSYLDKHMTVTASGQEDFAASTEMISVSMLGPISDEFRKQYGIDTEFKPFKAVTR